MSIASPPKNLEPQFALSYQQLIKSHSINEFATILLQKSDNKECEQSEQLDPIKPIFDTNSNNHHKLLKLSMKVSNFKYQCNSIFAQNILRFHLRKTQVINAISKMPRTHTAKPTLTKVRVNFSDNSLSNTAAATNTSSNTDTTPSISAKDTMEDLRLTETINRVFNKKLLVILTGSDAILNEVWDCVIWNDEDRLKEISPYICSYWRNMSVKHGCLCLHERIAILKAIKDAVLEDIHSRHPNNFAILFLAQNFWWRYIHQDILAKARECKACTEFCKNLKPVIPHSKWSPLPKCIYSNDEIKIEIGGAIINKKA